MLILIAAIQLMVSRRSPQSSVPSKPHVEEEEEEWGDSPHDVGLSTHYPKDPRMRWKYNPFCRLFFWWVHKWSMCHSLMVWDFCLHILTYNKVDSGLHSRLKTGPWTGNALDSAKFDVTWRHWLKAPISCGLQSYRKHLPCKTPWEINNRCIPVRIIGSKLCSLQLISTSISKRWNASKLCCWSMIHCSERFVSPT